ncbi:hypothetical protein COO60DRAFT_78338 [Scenedesmus sp. NREL 46B-D3]|nr:hypothetical protein COO60DRAFT_78338 [Scenedesmus sp. NREL 46B-D3]
MHSCQAGPRLGLLCLLASHSRLNGGFGCVEQTINLVCSAAMGTAYTVFQESEAHTAQFCSHLCGILVNMPVKAASLHSSPAAHGPVLLVSCMARCLLLKRAWGHSRACCRNAIAHMRTCVTGVFVEAVVSSTVCSAVSCWIQGLGLIVFAVVRLCGFG